MIDIRREFQIVGPCFSGSEDSAASEEGRRKAQEENEGKMRELLDEMEKQRQQALRNAEASAKLEDEEERRKLDRQRREREEKEEKQKEEARFFKLKSELMNYDF
ncbi:hypothetical protein ACROYT_G027437 [Oculina patagonica]